MDSAFQRFTARLHSNFEWSRRQQSHFLQKRMAILRQMAGRHYGNNVCKERVPKNYLGLFVIIYSRMLASRNPACMIETTDLRLRPVAKGTQIWANDRFRESGLEKILQRWAIDALTYNVGMIKVCDELDATGDYAEPYIDTIDPERFCWDMQATLWHEAQYAAHRYRFIKEDMLKAEGARPDRIMKLAPEVPSAQNEMGEEKTVSLSQDGTAQENLYDEHEAWEFYLPRENLLVSYPISGQTLDPKPIRVKEYRGPRGRECPLGPFHPLVFNEMPGNLMGIPPCHMIYDLHMAINRIVRKLLRQAEEQKDNILVHTVNRADADALKRARDGEILTVSDPKGFERHRSNGPDQQNIAFDMMLRQAINLFGSNFETIGGAGLAAPTATQETLLDANANKQLQFMQGEMLSRTREVMRSLIYYDWMSRRRMNYEMPVEGMPGMTVPWSVRPEQRPPQAFSQMNLTPHPYSMRPVTPEMRLAQMTALFTEALQAAPLLAQQGWMLDFGRYFQKKAEYMQFVDADEIIRFVPQDPTQQPPQEGQAAPRVRPPGVGQYTRTSVSGPEDQNQQILSMADTGDAA